MFGDSGDLQDNSQVPGIVRVSGVVSVVVGVGALDVLQEVADGRVIVDPAGRGLKGGSRRAGDAPRTPVIHFLHILDILGESAMDVAGKTHGLRLARIHRILDGDDPQEAGIRILVGRGELIDRVPIHSEGLTGDVHHFPKVVDGLHNERAGPDAQALDLVGEKTAILLVRSDKLARPSLEVGTASTVVARLRAVGAAALRCSVALLTRFVLRGAPRIRVVLYVLLEGRTTATIVTRPVAMTASNCSAVTHVLTFFRFPHFLQPLYQGWEEKSSLFVV